MSAPLTTGSIPVILNRKAGSSTRDNADVLTRACESLNGVRISECGSGEEMIACARSAVDNDAPLVVAAGGDGTISTIASVLAGSNTALGVLPMGTLNHFARDLGIPAELEEAARVIRHGHVERIDIGEVNGRIFINNSGLGLYPYMVHHREAQQRRGRRKWPAALLASIAALERYRMLRLTIHVDDQRLLRRTPAVFVGNNEYRFDVGVKPGRTSLQRGQLSLYLPRTERRIPLLFFTFRALLGRERHGGDAIEMLLTDEFTIETRFRNLRVSCDGEIEVMRVPLAYRVRAGALRVIVPEPPR